MEGYRKILEHYIPAGSVGDVLQLLSECKLPLRITKGRMSKLGDYRPPQRGRGHRITVNHDLNRYSFLIILVHEIAHARVWLDHGRTARPHGAEWKGAYRGLMQPFLRKDIFPRDIRIALEGYLLNPGASSGSDRVLTRVLKTYDARQETLLEELPDDAVFRIRNGKQFRKMERKRTRYRCLCLDNQRFYLISSMAAVIPAGGSR